MQRRDRSKSWGWCDDILCDEPSITANTVFESEQDEVIHTGLLDQHGRPITRKREKIRMGFVK